MKKSFLVLVLSLLTSSTFAVGVETLYSRENKQEFFSIGQRYIALLQQLSQDEQIERECAALFSPSLKKITNSQIICEGLADYQKQIKDFHATEKLKQVELLEIIKSENSDVVRFEITYQDGSVDTVISLLKYDDSGKIEEINQVYGTKGAYLWQAKEHTEMSQSFNFFPFKQADIPLLYEWLAREHVASWWRETRDYQKFYEKYAGRIQDNTIGCYLICHEDKPIGYIAWYDATHCPLRAQDYFGQRVYGFDVLIAETDYIGKGNGTKILQQFIDEIMMPLKPTVIIVDPEITNERAIHVYEKLGFKKVKEVQATDGVNMVPAILMELNV
jgi:aminoglycoside 6'-N-acetyltransferase